ncbi:helix-turn-helix transcriptional regulator [Trichormus sp. NMC-1]|uniref:helix-turn-helix domain-containing protein n=1 Tax=Trichormus sp. NMC-1 TaxID=1853259 RepID=UPI000AAB733B|nr:helix-turn-helix transcriptional regulator [Trichormus sp. NMC-1]
MNPNKVINNSDNVNVGLRSLTQFTRLAITLSELAAKISSSPPRIAKAENGDASVSIELLIRAILATGATPQDISQVIADVG